MDMSNNTFKNWFFSLPEPHQDDLERNKLLAEWVVKAFNAGINSAPPAQSLAEFENEVIERCAKVATDACLVPPDGGSPMSYEVELCDVIAEAIRELKGK